MYSMVTTQLIIEYYMLEKAAKKVDLKSSHHRKKICELMVCLTRLVSDHFKIYVNIQSCFTPETNIMLRQLYLNKKPFKKKKQQTKSLHLLNSYSGLPLIDLIFPATYEVELKCHSLFIGEELRLKEVKVICPRSHSQEVVETGHRPRTSGLQRTLESTC